MPDLAIEFEQGFEPFVERFHGLAAPRVQLLAAPAPQKPAALAAASRRARRGARLAPFARPRVFRAQETTAGSPTARVPFNPLAKLIVVVAAIRQDIVGFLRQVVDFGLKSRVLATA